MLSHKPPIVLFHHKLKQNRDKTNWQYFSRHWRDWFPNLPSRSSFVRQSANLWQYKQRIQHQLLKQDLAQIDIELETPLRKNMKDDRPQSQIHFGQKIWRLIETVNSQLSERFHFEQI